LGAFSPRPPMVVPPAPARDGTAACALPRRSL